MKRLLGWLTATCVLVLVGSWAWTHRHHIPIPVAAAPQTETQPGQTYEEAQEAQKMVTLTGPMADFITREQSAKVETIQPVSHKSTAADRVGDSPVGTSRVLLRQSFPLANAVDVPFELPAHAATPQLKGTYHAFVPSAGTAVSDDAANVEFLLFDQQQYSDFLSGRPSDALFSAEAAHDQEVNFGMPPTQSQPVKYYLIFRNSSRHSLKKVVQADFRIEF